MHAFLFKETPLLFSFLIYYYETPTSWLRNTYWYVSLARLTEWHYLSLVRFMIDFLYIFHKYLIPSYYVGDEIYGNLKLYFHTLSFFGRQTLIYVFPFYLLTEMAQ